jgi:isopenicillin N synthase-like dioxygenase
MGSITYSTIELMTPNGPDFRKVSTAAPRTPTAEEMPLIDLGPIDGDLEARKVLAMEIRSAAQNTGFFYVKNHGISEQLIQSALAQVQQFFAQPVSQKAKVAFRASGLSNGYHGVSTTQINKTESKGRFVHVSTGRI